jgi:hypothetical protein
MPTNKGTAVNFFEKLNDRLFQILEIKEDRRYLNTRLHLIENPSVVNLDDEFSRARAEFWHAVRLAVIMTSISIVLIPMMFFELDPLSKIFRILSLILAPISAVFIAKAFSIFMRKSDFIKSPDGNDLFEFIDQFGGKNRMRKWGDEFPILKRFLAANRTLESFSVFEYRLIEIYIKKQTSTQRL